MVFELRLEYYGLFFEIRVTRDRSLTARGTMGPTMFIQILMPFLIGSAWSAPVELAPVDMAAPSQESSVESVPQKAGPAETESPSPTSAKPTPPASSQAPVSLLGFKAWKQQQVFKARAILDATRRMPETSAPREGSQVAENKEEKSDSSNTIIEREERLRQLEFNHEIAQGLTIHDYFSLYLKSKSQEDMALIIPKLSPEELSALLAAYKKSLDGLAAPEKNDPDPEVRKL